MNKYQILFDEIGMHVDEGLCAETIEGKDSALRLIRNVTECPELVFESEAAGWFGYFWSKPSRIWRTRNLYLS